MMAATCRIDVKKYRAVLFDLDGVIMDTMGLHYESYRQAFGKFGICVTRLDIYRIEGMPSLEVGRAIVREKGAPLTDRQIQELIEEKREIYRSLAAREAKAYPGVPETLGMLRESGVRLALITGSNRKTTDMIIKKAGLEGAFDIVVTGDDTPRGKPFPDPYRTGMERLGIPLENCVVVENAPLGIASAKAAGAGYVIGVTTTLPEEYLKDADDIMPSFADIEECLARRLDRERISHIHS